MAKEIRSWAVSVRSVGLVEVAEYPLLILPEPTRAERVRRPRGRNAIRKPEHGVQAQRLVPQFRQLRVAMEQKRVSLQDNPLGIEPEQVLVLETYGSIADFVNAVRRIEGLEWLGEFEQSDMAPEYGFARESTTTRESEQALSLIHI